MPIPRDCKQGIKSRAGAMKCCKEKNTSPLNEWRNIPFNLCSKHLCDLNSSYKTLLKYLESNLNQNTSEKSKFFSNNSFQSILMQKETFKINHNFKFSILIIAQSSKCRKLRIFLEKLFPLCELSKKLDCF